MIVKTAREELIRFKGKAIGLGVFSLLGTLGIVGQAWFFAVLIEKTFFEGLPLDAVWSTVTWLIASVVLRMVATYCQEQTAGRLAELAKQDLRHKIWHHLLRLGPFTGERHGDVVHLMTDGLESVEAYIARYVPQMLYAMMIPLIMAIAIIDAAPWVAIILLITFPLIPFFMILIGKKAEAMNKEQWERMSFLSGHFLDVLQGIVTLKLFGRSEEQVDVIARLSAEFRDSTLRVLRVAFLSALVLELVSTISTALIAVYMGMALLYGHETFLPAFFVLLLAPEFYASLRQLGAAFHTGMAGQVSLAKIDDFLALPIEEPKSGSVKTAELNTVEFKDVSYAYGAGHTEVGDNKAADSSEKAAKPYAVENIAFTLHRGEKAMLVGGSGAGKSTLAHLLLRLMQPTKGQILVDGVNLLHMDADFWRDQVTFVPQQPHLFRGTLRENITFGQAVADDVLWAAVRDAEAEAFVNSLPQGLDTILGEGGLGLSGGQRQRIAIARAFIKQSPIIVLDEVTAHLDVATEQSLAKALERLMANKIVLLIGHRLQTMRWADTLLVLKQGHIVEHGSFDELLAADGYFSELVKAGLGGDVNTDSDAKLHADTSISMTAVSAASTSASALATSSAGTVTDTTVDSTIEQGVHPIIATHATAGATNIVTGAGVSADEKNISPWDSLRRLFAVLGPARNSLWLSLLFSFLTVFMNVGLLTTSAWLITSAALRPELAALSLSIVGVRFFGISRAVCRYIERYVSHHMAFQGLYGLRVWFYKKLEPLMPAALHRLGSGDILGRIMADIETLQFFYLRVIIPPAGAVLLTVIGFYFLAQFSYQLVWLLAIVFILGAVVIPFIVYRHNALATDAALMYRSGIKDTVVESLAGIMDIITYKQEPRVTALVDRQFADLTTAQHKVHRGTNLGDTLFLGLTQFTMVLGALIMIPIANGSQQEGIFIAVVAIALQSYFEALAPLTIAWYHGRESLAAMKRLVQLAEQAPAVKEVTSPAENMASQAEAVTSQIENATSQIKKSISSAENMTVLEPQSLGITFDKVSFRYDGDDPYVYQNLSLSIKPGEKVAVVGPSGSGKTTLLTMLERFYDYEGHIYLGDQDLRTMSLAGARNYYGALTQDTYLFHASVEDNIRLAKPRATAEEMAKAIEFAALTDWVNTLPNGLKTIIGSGGSGVSGGQRQRIALARLWLRNSPILLLDEPLEGLDQLVRQDIQNSLYTLMKGKTVIYITHHLGGLEKMDRILFLENGQVVEDGAYESLMAKRGAFYAYRKLSMETV
ncbi:MAG: thiol reductant ABC exporter subunit CydD [Veillonella sp.]|uniref:thiol reductant ABC exporter subunit CydD n=1 Tax=Veillonella sp. TaxID=1926307 RepID=UPI0025EE224E|nr:thiol reductant ABC exporter subunit CydD [Veillonella sp.]MBE6079363.1 thiol reductant ABC exporter subunit CydD [Veillonella sp.]